MAPNPTKTRRWVTLDAGAEYLGISRKTLRRLVSSGQITGYRAGPRLIRLDISEIDAMLAPIPTAATP